MPPEQAESTSLDALNEAFMELDRAYDQLAQILRLSEPEYWSLVLIRHGVETQREISERLTLSPQTIHSAFKLLVKKRSGASGALRPRPAQQARRPDGDGQGLRPWSVWPLWKRWRPRPGTPCLMRITRC